MDLLDDPPWIIILILVYLGLSLLIAFTIVGDTITKLRGYPRYIRKHWQESYPSLSLSAKTFYDEVTEKIRALELKDVSVERVFLYQTNVFGGAREYLRVKRQNFMFDICAAPYGTTYFVSWWLGEKISGFTSFCLHLPIIGKPLRKNLETRTYYEMDTEGMFLGAVQYAVSETIKEMQNPAGIARMKAAEVAERMLQKKVEKEKKEEAEEDFGVIGDEWKLNDEQV